MLKQIAVPGVLATFVIAFLAAAEAIRGREEELPPEIITPFDILRVALYSLPALISLIVSVTYMFGVLMAFGRLAQQNELTAMRAAGISLKRVVLPVILVGAMLSVACFIVQDRVQPWAVKRVFELVYTELPLRATLDALPPGEMHKYGGWRVYFGDRNKATHELQDLMIVRPEEAGSSTVFYANRAKVRRTEGGQIIDLYDGHFIPPDNNRLEFETMEVALPSLTSKRVRNAREARSLVELFAEEQRLEHEVMDLGAMREYDKLRSERREIGIRFALPFACLAVTFAAAPLGARARRGGRSYTFASGFGIVLLYYILYVLTDPPLVLPLWLTMLLAVVPNVVLIVLGSIFLWRVDRV